ncbi:hypothetical protein KNP414_07527 [Paenibacillus mucilaginosus KNP414]|uniref:Uncharacterized protein n=1 Tax=Paenibacillus mucilaginosus (strain KNP414) TaxID=1036673 RepID=F8FA48_PAEMK|nr:hypothetical protein KNP414_07527 [Paenibacillus mucilaginosus KNP414]
MSKSLFHRLLTTKTGVVDEPTQTQCSTTLWSYFDWHLVVRAPHTASFDFKNRHNVLNCLFEHFHWIFAGTLLNEVEGVIKNSLRYPLLPVIHDTVDQASNQLAVIHRIGQYVSASNWTFTRHSYPPFSKNHSDFDRLLLLHFRTLRAVLGTSLLTVVHTCCIQRTTNDVVTYTRKVLYTTAADQYYAVLLQVVSDTRNISCNFNTVSQTNTRILTKSGVRLLWRHRTYTSTHTAFLWRADIRRFSFQSIEAFLESRGFGFYNFCFPSFTNELVDCWHFGHLLQWDNS